MSTPLATMTAAGWVKDGTVWGSGQAVSLDAAMALVGDAGFMEHSDVELRERAFGDRELFTYIYGQSVAVSAFGADVLGGWVHKRALARLDRLRRQWEGTWYRQCRLPLLSEDTRWMRFFNREHYREYVELLRAAAFEPPVGGVLCLVAGAARPELGEQAARAVEERYRAMWRGRKLSWHLREELGLGNKSDGARRGVMRSVARLWDWAREGRALAGGDVLPGLTVEVPSVLGSEARSVEVARGGRAMELGEVGRRVATRLAEVMREGVGAVKAQQPLAGLAKEVWESLGFSVRGGRVMGRLRRGWSRGLATALRSAFTDDEALRLLDDEGAVKTLGREIIRATGLIPGRTLAWSGDTLGSGLVERARMVAVERLVRNHMMAEGYEIHAEGAGVLGGVASVARGTTVFREAVLERLKKDVRQTWLELEEAGTTELTSSSMAGVRLAALVDGLAAAYLEVLGLAGKLPTGDWPRVEGFWRESSAPFQSVHLAVVRDALVAAQVWAFLQVVGDGHRWLGLSPSYRRSLLNATRKLFSVAVQIRRSEAVGEWELFHQHDGLLRGDTFEVAGYRLPGKVTVGEREYCLGLDRATAQYLRVLGEKEDEGSDRAFRQVVSLLGLGAERLRRCLLVQAAVKQEGSLPAGLLPLVPVDLPDPLGYAAVLEKSSGYSLADLMWWSPKDPAWVEATTKLGAASPHLSAEQVALGLFASDGPAQMISQFLAEKFPWDVLEEHWKYVSARPTLAGLGGYSVAAPMVCIRRVLRSLGSSGGPVHPFIGAPLWNLPPQLPAHFQEWMRAIWSPFFVEGRVPRGPSSRYRLTVVNLLQPARAAKAP